MTAILAYQLAIVVGVVAGGAAIATFNDRRKRQADLSGVLSERWTHQPDPAAPVSPNRTYVPWPPEAQAEVHEFREWLDVTERELHEDGWPNPPDWCCEWGERAAPGPCPWHPPEALCDEWPPPRRDPG